MEQEVSIYGYTHRLIWVDLTTQSIQLRTIDDETIENYTGGVGIGTKILYDEGLKTRNPLDPGNPLIIMTGPFSGTIVPTSSRVSITTVSPATSTYGESDIGGTWGATLKKAGYDGVAITGKSEKPVSLVITSSEIKIRDAGLVWGKDTFHTQELLQKEFGDKIKVMCIGPAGEKLSNMAAIFTDGVHARAAGRGGLGAVMGSKNLKAIIVLKGNIKSDIYQTVRLHASVKKHIPGAKELMKGLSQCGTGGGLLVAEDIGALPIKNWKLGSWKEGAIKIAGEVLNEKMVVGKFFCGSCVVGCGRVVRSLTPYGPVYGGGPEYETLAALGSNCLVDDLDAIAVANELCNRYGIDTISCGSAIAFAMEAYEQGLITKEDVGYELRWGDPRAMLRLVEEIGSNTGFGKTLGLGVAAASNEIGQGAGRFAVHVKGLEPPMHDPRACASMGLAYATNPNGATHWPACNVVELKKISIPAIGIYAEQLKGPFSEEGKALLVKQLQDYMTMFNSLKMCRFFIRIQTSTILEWLNMVTNLDFDAQTLMLTGERISNLKRMCNVRLGVPVKDDTLPDRITKDKRNTGGSPDYLPNIELMTSEYYAVRGWSESGVPLPEKTAELGLTEEAAIMSSQSSS